MVADVCGDPTENALREAIEALYTVFPARSYTGPLTYSPVLDLAKKSVTLDRTSRRAVDRELLIEYGRRAMIVSLLAHRSRGDRARAPAGPLGGPCPRCLLL